MTDTDREIFRSFDMELAPTAREDSCIQKFYLYLMLCKPSRKLILTWAASSGDGKSMRPSSLIGEVKSCLGSFGRKSALKRDIPSRRSGTEDNGL